MSRTSKLKQLAGAAVIAAAAAGLAAPAEADTIKIGSSLSVTGPAAFLGDPEAKTLRMYVEKINEEGGVLGRQLELVIYDDEGDASRALTFAERLIEDDGVVAVVGGTTTGTTMAMVPAFEEAQIPFISLAGAVVIIDPLKEWVFKTPHTDRMACEKIFEDMQAQGISQIGMISGTGGFDASMREQCLDVAPDYGIEVVADETYGPRDTDMTPQLTNIRATQGVEAVINPGFGQGPAIVTRNFAALGFDVPLYQSHGVASRSFIELAEDAAEGVRMPTPLLLVADHLAEDDPHQPVVTSYKETYEAETGESVSTFGGYAYDGLMLLVDAIERADSAEPAAIRDALEQTEGFVGVTGTFNMTPEDHMGLDITAFRMVEIKDGDFVPID